MRAQTDVASILSRMQQTVAIVHSLDSAESLAQYEEEVDPVLNMLCVLRWCSPLEVST